MDRPTEAANIVDLTLKLKELRDNGKYEEATMMAAQLAEMVFQADPETLRGTIMLGERVIGDEPTTPPQALLPIEPISRLPTSPDRSHAPGRAGHDRTTRVNSNGAFPAGAEAARAPQRQSQRERPFRPEQDHEYQPTRSKPRDASVTPKKLSTESLARRVGKRAPHRK